MVDVMCKFMFDLQQTGQPVAACQFPQVRRELTLQATQEGKGGGREEALPVLSSGAARLD